METDGIPGLAERLDHLFTTVPAPTKSGRYSNDAAAHVLAERGVVVSGVHLSHLRSGRRDNPSARLLVALAELFGVPMGYFFDTALHEQINQDLDMLLALKEGQCRRLLTKSLGVSAESLESLITMLDRMRQLEGLDTRRDET